MNIKKHVKKRDNQFRLIDVVRIMTDFRIGVVQNPKSVLVRREKKKNGSNQPDEEMVIYFFFWKR